MNGALAPTIHEKAELEEELKQIDALSESLRRRRSRVQQLLTAANNAKPEATAAPEAPVAEKPPPPGTRERGKVADWKAEKNFGFIKLPRESKQLFVHRSALQDGVTALVREATVTFERGEGKKPGDVVAINVRVEESPAAPTSGA